MKEFKLHDESLRGIDPFDETLSEDVKKQIIQECVVNFDYFTHVVIQVTSKKKESMKYITFSEIRELMLKEAYSAAAPSNLMEDSNAN